MKATLAVLPVTNATPFGEPTSPAAAPTFIATPHVCTRPLGVLRTPGAGRERPDLGRKPGVAFSGAPGC